MCKEEMISCIHFYEWGLSYLVVGRSELLWYKQVDEWLSLCITVKSGS